jgi:hypothetical protein
MELGLSEPAPAPSGAASDKVMIHIVVQKLADLSSPLLLL